jgi:hypothetical protein
MGRWLLAVVAVVLVTGCSTAPGQRPDDPGGPRREDRSIPAASVVELAASGTLTVHTGAPALRITAGRRVIAHLTSDVQDGAHLVLGTDRPMKHPGAVHYDLTLPAVREVDLSGSGAVLVAGPSRLDIIVLSGTGEVRVEGLTTETLSVTLPGSGHVSVVGTATRQSVLIQGPGGFDGHDLATQRSAVTVEGSGVASVRVGRTLEAVVEGSGTITYEGGAIVTGRIVGSGRITSP